MRTFGKPEKTLLFAVAVALLAAYTWWIHFRYPLQHADSALHVQVADRMAQTGRPVSQVAEAERQLGLAVTLETPADVLCKAPLPGPGPGEFNFFTWHTYLDFYLYLPLFVLLGGALGLSLLTAASFVLVPVAAYVALRTEAVPVALSAIVAALLSLHPVWAGGVQGDFYGDRLFVGPAFVLCLLLFTRRFASCWVIPLALLLTLSGERMGAIAGALMIGAVILADPWHPREWWKQRVVLGFGLLGIAWTAVLLIAVRMHPHYEGYWQSLQPSAILLQLRDNPVFLANLVTFATINFVAWGIPALGCWRGLLLALIVMLPNILGNYGGGEKTGFFTHYHSFYYPVLAAAVCLSFVRFHRNAPRWASWGFAGWLAVAGLAYNIALNQYDFRFTEVATRSLAYPFKGYAWEHAQVEYRNALRAHMDRYPGSVVSTTEWFMPVLSPRHPIAYYPLGIDDSDFIVLPQSPVPGLYVGTISYLGDEEARKIDTCLTARLRDAGWRVEKEMTGAVILSRRPAAD